MRLPHELKVLLDGFLKNDEEALFYHLTQQRQEIQQADTLEEINELIIQRQRILRKAANLNHYLMTEEDYYA